MTRARYGIALLEVLIALAILGLVGAAMMALSIESGIAVTRTAAAELQLRDASAFMEAVALWPREDLDRRLGTRVQGKWLLTVTRRNETLYEVQLHDSGRRQRLIETVLYRPREPEARHGA